MTDPIGDATCARLRTLLAAVPEGDHGDPAQMIDAHIASCFDCQAAERRLLPLIERYRATEQPPLPDKLLQRLLDRICP